jgi:hypothetical protein
MGGFVSWLCKAGTNCKFLLFHQNLARNHWASNPFPKTPFTNNNLQNPKSILVNCRTHGCAFLESSCERETSYDFFTFTLYTESSSFVNNTIKYQENIEIYDLLDKQNRLLISPTSLTLPHLHKPRYLAYKFYNRSLLGLTKYYLLCTKQGAVEANSLRLRVPSISTLSIRKHVQILQNCNKN